MNVEVELIPKVHLVHKKYQKKIPIEQLCAAKVRKIHLEMFGTNDRVQELGNY